MSRTLIVVAALLVFALPVSSLAGDPPNVPVRVFEFTGSGTVQHVHGPALGSKSFTTKIKKATIAQCVQTGGGGDCSSLTDSPEGKVYLYIFSRNVWGVGTTPDPEDGEILVLNGHIDGKGKFMFAGTDPLTQVSVVAQGKAKLEKEAGNALLPKKLGGRLYAVDTGFGEHHSSVKFKTVGKPLVIEV